MRGDPRQQRLPLTRAFAPTREHFVVTSTNASTVAVIDAWPSWPGDILALVGPEGSGKSHLARAWAARADATVVERDGDLRALRGRPLLIDDADRGISDEDLFHVINAVGPGASLLITSRRDPRTWPVELGDLESRLAAIPTTRLSAPDDVTLGAVMRKLFRERNIEPPEDVIEYLLRRIERAFPAARDVVNRIDERAAAHGREVNRGLVREVLEGDDRTLGLFD